MKQLNVIAILFFMTCTIAACTTNKWDKSEGHLAPELNQAIGSIEIIDPRALQLIDPTKKIFIRADGFRWTEGPLWVDELQALLFSDIPNNRIMQYQPGIGTRLYLEPAGATALFPDDDNGGSNGLLLNNNNELILLQQGDRRIALMIAPLNRPAPQYKNVASEFKGKRLNSPNDAVLSRSGNLYFTDPPYGLAGGMTDKRRAIAFQGIYKVTPSGESVLLDDQVKSPNGIGLSIDQKTLYIGVSDPEHPHWLAYDLDEQGNTSNKRVFYDATKFKNNIEHQGVPDGMATHSSGVLFATGPGGVWIFSPAGEVLAKIYTEKLTANCTLSSDEKTLFITAHDTLMSLSLK
ncbi:SMP-30/gluconolactonase/LRE family protein [Cellvibrio sp. KY-GH-1]|uniref:SMP-30/gluconolactonase/LRE family protein n=1 Tax=Cellvibrio sp. KY-GH-1 TaxID=2303332 RepID=UPI001CDA2DA1|nr:SMP-30/gluconolactonase/LRE family protein [Cellvibrio sp. KY-GH-1]